MGIAVKQAASPWNVVFGRSRIGVVVAYLNTYAQQNVALDLVVAHKPALLVACTRIQHPYPTPLCVF